MAKETPEMAKRVEQALIAKLTETLNLNASAMFELRAAALSLAVEHVGPTPARTALAQRELSCWVTLHAADTFAHWLLTGRAPKIPQSFPGPATVTERHDVSGIHERPGSSFVDGVVRCRTFPRPAGLAANTHWHECDGPELHSVPSAGGREDWHWCSCSSRFATHHARDAYAPTSPSGKTLCACGELWPCDKGMEPPP